MSDQPKGKLSDRIAQTQIHRIKQALQSAEQAVDKKFPVDAELRQYMARNKSLGSRDRRLIRDTVFSYYRWKPWLEKIAEEKQNPDVSIYLAGVLCHEILPPSIQVLGEELGIAMEPPRPSASVQEIKDALQFFCETELNEDALFPAWLQGALPEFLRSEPADTWLERPPTWLRILDSKTAIVQQAFERQNLSAPRKHSQLPLTYTVSQNFPEQSLIKASEGGFIIQDIASQVVVDLCRDLPVNKWWDACCGAGGKTIGIADDGSRKVLASDVRSSATRKLHERRRSHPNLNIKVVSLDATREIPNDGLYDGVLIDAPCSGQGTWGRNPDLRWRTDEHDLENRVAEQQTLLENCAKAVSENGYLVYSVCSLTNIETNEVIEAFLDTHNDFQPLGVSHPILPRHWEKGAYILPSMGPGNGMYMSILQRSA